MKKRIFQLLFFMLFLMNTSGCTANKYTVQFETNGGDIINDVYIVKGNLVEIPTTSKIGHTLDGWYTSLDGGKTLDERWSFTTNTVSNNLKLYAKWTINSYNINFINAGSIPISSKKLDFGEVIHLPIPTKEGYNFMGWYTSLDFELEFEEKTMPAADVDLYGSWIVNSYTINFESNGGSVLPPITQNYNSKIEIDLKPEKEGHFFEGWYSDEDLTKSFSINLMPSSNMTVYAKWTPLVYQIRYNLNGGTNVNNPSSFVYENGNIRLSEPTKEGYTFLGWYENNSFDGIPLIEIDKLSNKNYNLFAKWDINEYTISFNSNGGTLIKNIKLNYNTPLGDFDEPTKEGYAFSGWYTDKNFNKRANFNKMPPSNTNLYAKWEIINYQITYYLNGGVNSSNPIEYNIETCSLLLLPPTKENHTFKGWFFDSDFSGDAITEIKNHILDNINLYAKWQINSYTIQFDILGLENSDESLLTLHKDERILDVCLGEKHSLLLTTLGRVFSWGGNEFGQLGTGTLDEEKFAIEITENFNLVEAEEIINIFVGSYHSLAITNFNRVFAWGYNGNGQLGSGARSYEPLPVNIVSSINLDIDETVIKIFTSAYDTFVLTSTNKVISLGIMLDMLPQFNLTEGESIIKIAPSVSHVVALSSSGNVYTWGSNSYGQLGNNSTIREPNPISITNYFNLKSDEKIIDIFAGVTTSYALTDSKKIYAWGGGDNGILGNGTVLQRTTPTNITTNFDLDGDDYIKKIVSGLFINYVLTNKGKIFEFGNGYWNKQKILPTDITDELGLINGEMIQNVYSGVYHFGVETSFNLFYLWGYNYGGSIGDGSNGNGSQLIPFITKKYNATETHTYEYASLVMPHKPILEGYEFDGWYTDKQLFNKYIPRSMPNYNFILYGKWNKIE